MIAAVSLNHNSWCVLVGGKGGKGGKGAKGSTSQSAVAVSRSTSQALYSVGYAAGLAAAAAVVYFAWSRRSSLALTAR